MGVILDRHTRVLVQGITGKESSFWTEKMLESGTNIVAGVTPGKGGTNVHGIPVYDTVQESIKKEEVDMTILYVPAAYTKLAAFEAVLAGIKKIVLLADGFPVQDMLELLVVARHRGVMLVGPNTPGMATLGEAMVGFIPTWLENIYKPGSIGLITRSGTLTNEISSHIVAAGYGISTLIGCGGDTVPGTKFVDVLRIFENDKKTEAIVMVGEIGGTMEEDAAQFVKEEGYNKPIIAYIAGRTAPEGKRMGHAGAIISKGRGSVKNKQKVLNEANITIALTPAEIQQILPNVLIWKN